MKYKRINDVLPFNKIGESLSFGDAMLLKQNIPFTHRTTNKNGINKQIGHARHLTKVHHDIESFFSILSTIGHKERYGNILQDDKRVEQLINIYTTIHQKYAFTDTLYALRSWDHYAYSHSFDVFILGTCLAQALSLKNLEVIALGYLFHDIGKIKTPQHILHKPDKLSPAEFDTIKAHTFDGEAILYALKQSHIAKYARSHHERLDGSGYPDGLFAEQLSPEMRILQLVDVYSALTLDRPYRQAMSAQDALAILINDKDRFDQTMLQQFIKIININPFTN
ncbi:HD-GYP domain-containing protein [Lentibacillus saliphilus]|uniref:HD-GYP domain-containing protein n=1 Tax=Lentibacillus saliphilus TaxID=2737028 RepID=UPI001C2F7534|nr:HD domain-containing phosphohydrolase [Lentibacillus saliphilus]